MANKRSFFLGEVDEATRSVRVIASTRDPVKGIKPTPEGLPQERWESLESWRLERYALNPVVLFQHDPLTPIGWARDVQVTENGLEMRIEFAPANVEPKAEEVYQKVRAKLIRGISVGFDFGSETIEERDGKTVSVFRDNELHETSIVTIPADANAVVNAPRTETVLTPDEQRRQAASRAGADLAKHRYTRVDANDEIAHFDYLGELSKLGKLERTPTGGYVVPARIARTGILVYRLPDGSVRRELRLAEDCFKSDSLATLNKATVTDLAHHRELIDADNWKEASLGHVDNVRQDGNYVVADLNINDAAAIEAIERGELLDTSAGYRCRLEWTSGNWKGERYDAIQRDIKYNHVAVLPPGRGRAGADVGLRLDSTDDGFSLAVTETHMAETKTLIRLDGKDFEVGSQAHIQHLENRYDALERDHKTKLSELQTKLDAANKAKDEAEARLDQASARAKKEKEDLEAAAAKDKEERAAKAKAFRQLRRRAKKAHRALEDLIDKEEGDEDDEEDKETKSDALDELLDDMSDREVMISVIKADSDDFDPKGRSDDYITARFDALLEQIDSALEEAAQERSDSVDAVVRTIESGKRKTQAARGEDPEGKARAEMVARNRELSTKPIGVSRG